MSTRPRPAHLALVAISLAALLAACSGSTPGGPSAPVQLPDASGPVLGSSPAPVSGSGDSDASCTLVTKDAFGQATGFPIATTSGAGGICYFQNTDPSKYLVVWVFGNQAAMAAMLQIEDSSEHIAGLGDDAFWAGAGGSCSSGKATMASSFRTRTSSSRRTPTQRRGTPWSRWRELPCRTSRSRQGRTTEYSPAVWTCHTAGEYGNPESDQRSTGTD